jgi:pimeloyl-ACP methyl ester carboxylesterase
MNRTLIYLGGNGHCAGRLVLARQALQRLTTARRIAPFELVDLAYPGFEDRTRAADLDAFLNILAQGVSQAAQRGGKMLLYGTGIGALLALCLRARGECLEVPLLMQGPVLWGLEQRLMPRVMRLGLARFLLGRVFATGWFQRRFVRKQFERPLAPEMRAAFFDGYARCPALADLFAWLTPRLLRTLERQCAERPEALERIGVWWGEHDHVVNLQELAWTEQALHVRWPVRRFPAWGHYPMIDEPDDWVKELADVLAAPERLPGPVGPQAR